MLNYRNKWQIYMLAVNNMTNMSLYFTENVFSGAPSRILLFYGYFEQGKKNKGTHRYFS